MRKTVLVTGSSRGIGKAIALEFARNNYTIILNGTEETDYSKRTLKAIKKISPRSDIFYFDVINISQVENAFRTIFKRFESIDVLVNNAGINRDSTLLKMNYDNWDIVIKTNLYGPFYVIKQILPHMIKNKSGKIINISSVVGISGNFGQSNYSSSKAGLLGLTKTLAKEVARFNINVNAVCPGFTKTEMVEAIPDEILNTKILPKIPMRRFAQPREIARLVLFLSSEDSNYITGSAFDINGGLI
jgi:3-oxoacyl-[acyl-carrier protein] reductase